MDRKLKTSVGLLETTVRTDVLTAIRISSEIEDATSKSRMRIVSSVSYRRLASSR
ncbi:MAG: hypothetical protein WC648_00255 [Candidatus Paceibacterota bacterium]